MLLDPNDPAACASEQAVVTYLLALKARLPGHVGRKTAARSVVYVRSKRWWRRAMPAVAYRHALCRARIASWCHRMFRARKRKFRHGDRGKHTLLSRSPERNAGRREAGFVDPVDNARFCLVSVYQAKALQLRRGTAASAVGGASPYVSCTYGGRTRVMELHRDELVRGERALLLALLLLALPVLHCCATAAPGGLRSMLRYSMLRSCPADVLSLLLRYYYYHYYYYYH